MSKIKLNAIVTQALIDEKFRADILNGHRRERLMEFNLSPSEMAAMMAIKADNLDRFIHQVGNVLYAS